MKFYLLGFIVLISIYSCHRTEKKILTKKEKQIERAKEKLSDYSIATSYFQIISY